MKDSVIEKTEIFITRDEKEVFILLQHPSTVLIRLTPSEAVEIGHTLIEYASEVYKALEVENRNKN